MGLEAWPHPDICGKGGQFNSFLKKNQAVNKKTQDTSAAMLFQAAVNID